MILIKDIMSHSPMTIEESSTVRKAKQLMSHNSFRHLPVVADGNLIGILTDRDLKLAQAVTNDDAFDDNCTVGNICVRNVYVVDHNAPAKEVLTFMAKERIGSALITEDEKLTGIFTVTDACKAFAQYLDEEDGL